MESIPTSPLLQSKKDYERPENLHVANLNANTARSANRSWKRPWCSGQAVPYSDPPPRRSSAFLPRNRYGFLMATGSVETISAAKRASESELLMTILCRSIGGEPRQFSASRAFELIHWRCRKQEPPFKIGKLSAKITAMSVRNHEGRLSQKHPAFRVSTLTQSINSPTLFTLLRTSILTRPPARAKVCPGNATLATRTTWESSGTTFPPVQRGAARENQAKGQPSRRRCRSCS